MRKILCATVVLLIFCGATFIEDAVAIPAFAKKYKTTCVTCHAQFPKLSAFGEAFRLNGFQIPGGQDELYVKDEPMSLGAEAYKKMFPDSIWPTTIPWMPPLSVIITDDVLVDTTGRQKNSTNFNFDNSFRILGGGAFGDNIAFWGGVEITDRGDATATEAFLMYKNLLSCYFGDHHFNLRTGLIGNFEMSLPNVRWDQSYQANDYLYATELGLDNQPGFEINGYDRNWKYAVGIVKTDQNNSERDYYAQVNFKFGGLGFDGSGAQKQEGGLAAPPQYWRDDSISFGGFWYRSYDSFSPPTNPTNFNATQVNPFDRFGGDVQLRYCDFTLGAGYARGNRNDSIVGTIFGPDADLSVLPNTIINENLWTIDAQYFVLPWVLPYARYEKVHVTNLEGLDKDRMVLGVSFLIRANIRLNFEGRYYFQNQPLATAVGFQNQGVAGFDPTIIDADQVAFRLMWGF